MFCTPTPTAALAERLSGCEITAQALSRHGKEMEELTAAMISSMAAAIRAKEGPPEEEEEEGEDSSTTFY